MLSKLSSIESTYLGLKAQMMDESIFSDMTRMRDVARQMSQMEESYNLYQSFKQQAAQRDEANQILTSESDPDLVSMAREQLMDANEKISKIEEQMKVALLPKDPNDDKNIFLEVRPAAGGDEAWLFAAELYKCYMLYAQSQWWKVEIIDEQFNDIGGVKNVVVKISWEKIYSKMKRESWVHRVQRVPATESQGRIHTSTVTVAVVPEAEEVDITIDPNDVEIDTYAASSSWWQNANKNQTGVRLRHKPSWLIVTIGDSKSQLHNKEKARAVLRSRLFQIEMDRKQSEQTNARLDQIGGGDRSEKIKTYNFPQDRLTDHRIKESRSNLPSIMQWNIDEMIHAAILANQAALLTKATE